MKGDVFRQMHSRQQPNGRHKLSDLTVGLRFWSEPAYVPDRELRPFDCVDGVPCAQCHGRRYIRLRGGRICRRCGQREAA